MPATRAPKALREGSVEKRSAILAAARDLFLADGFDRSSVDAVAARAGVSKRTVYDYFGDKEALLLAVVESTGESLLSVFRRAIEETLTGVTDLQSALVAFTMRIATETLGSVDYLAFTRLVAMESAQLPRLRDHWTANAPEEAIAERLAVFARAGLIEAPNPRLAADHFGALTFLLAFNALGPSITTEEARLREIFVEGVRAFLRAYAPSRAAPRGDARRTASQVGGAPNDTSTGRPRKRP